MGYLKALLVSLILLFIPGEGSWEPPNSEAAQEPAVVEPQPERSFALRISFGYSDVTSELWEGSFEVQNVRIEEARGWELQSVDHISLNSFELHTFHPSREVAVPKGIVVRGIALPGARFQIDTDQGSFAFPVEDLEGGNSWSFWMERHGYEVCSMWPD